MMTLPSVMLYIVVIVEPKVTAVLPMVIGVLKLLSR